MSSASEVKKSLIKQLEERGADIELNRALVNDYMFYYQQEIQMHKSVRKEGRIIEAVSSTGKEYMKENPAVKDAVMYNKQKLAILKQLEIAPSTVIDTDNDEL